MDNLEDVFPSLQQRSILSDLRKSTLDVMGKKDAEIAKLTEQLQQACATIIDLKMLAELDRNCFTHYVKKMAVMEQHLTEEGHERLDEFYKEEAERHLAK